MRFSKALIILIILQFTPITQNQLLAQGKLTEVPDCFQIGYNYLKMLPVYHKDDDTDSLELLVNNYRENCSLPIHYDHYELLSLISKNAFDEKQYPDLLQLLMDYHERMNHDPFYWNQPYQYREAWLKVHKEYYNYLKSWAGQMLVQRNITAYEYEILLFYSGGHDEVFTNLRNEKVAGSDLQNQFNNWKEKVVFDNEVHLGLLTGAWNPTSNLKRLGIHPEIGVSMGIFSRKMHYNLNGGLRFLDAPQPYSIGKYDSIHTNDHYSSGFIGLEVGRSIYRSLKHDLQLGMGLGVEGITYYSKNVGDNTETEEINTFNYNIGIGYSYYYNYLNYLKLDVRFHWLNYKNHINNDLSGNAVTLRLLWCITNNDKRKVFATQAGY